VDLCEKVAQSLNVRPVIVVVTAMDRIPELQQGRIDIIFGKLAYTTERSQQIGYSHPYLFLTTKIMVKKESGIQNFEQLSGKKIAIPKGSTQETQIRTQIPSANILSLDTLTQAFLAFTQNKAAAFVADEETLASNRLALGEKANDVIILPKTLMVEYIGAGVRKGEDTLAQKINNVFTNLEKSGEADAIFMKWFGPDTETGFKQRGFKIDGSGDIPKEMMR
jgi:polar amino acid transport system substrate-binding protein